MKKYLVPIDGSPNSEIAIKTAVALAKKTGGSITLLCVIDTDTLLVNHQVNVGISGIMDKTKEAFIKMLDDLVEKYLSTEFEFTKLVKYGNITNEILDEAEHGYNLIVIGSRGLSLISRTFLGSVSNKVVNSSKVSVLVVKEYHENDFSKILIPVDGSTNSKRALYVASDIGEYFGSELTLVNVVNKLQLPDIKEVDIGNIQEYYPKTTEISNMLLKDSAKKIDNYGHKIQLVSKVGNVAETIIHMAEEEDFDLIVMGNRGLGTFSRAFLGSVSNSVLNHTKKSVLIIH